MSMDVGSMNANKLPLTIVLPIASVNDIEDLHQFLSGYGQCLTLNEARSYGTKEKTIVVGKVLRTLEVFKNPNGEDKKVYYLESAAVDDTGTYRFVASGTRLIRMIDDVFSVDIGDFLALFEPKVMENAADLPTFYLDSSKMTVWVCKGFAQKKLPSGDEGKGAA